jgi:CelD/BcsL family acetyltransferase involved in cellulose biosynthesis
MRYRLLAAGMAEPLEALSAPGMEGEVAAACATALAGATPRPALLQFDRITASSDWPERIRSAWPGRRRPAVRRSHHAPAPALSLEYEDFDAWMKTKSRNFRSQVGRSRRKLDAAGGRFRTSTVEELSTDLEALARLHFGRWAHRGGAESVNAGIRRMLAVAGRELIPQGRFRLWCLDVAGETVSAHLFVAAGDELAYWLGGFDERFAKEHPGLITLVVAIGDALAREDARVDLGPGGQDYKYRLADSEERLELVSLIPPGPFEAVVRGELSGRRAARFLLRR